MACLLRIPVPMRVLAAALLPMGVGTQAATVSLSPGGSLLDQRNVKVVVTAQFRPGAAIERFRITYNGNDITATFLQHAVITQPGPGTAVATLDALPAAGSHALTATLKVSGEDAVTGSTTFTVPASDQERRRAAVVTRIGEYLRKYDRYLFSSTISLGDIGAIEARTKDSSFQVYVDPDGLRFGSPEGTTASYVEYAGLSYYRDLVLAIDPQDFSLTRQPQSTYNPLILWHEMLHAMSHLANQTVNAPNRLLDPGQGTDPESIDHFYTEWAEACMNVGLGRLVMFENHLVNQGKGVPSAAALTTGRNYWRTFVNACNTSNDPRGVPDAEQRASFKRLIGFDVDPAAIEGTYRLLGWPKEYFEVATVSIVSPGATSTVGTDRVDVKAEVILAPGARLEASGFVVNGSVHLVPLAGTVLAASLPVAPGANTIQAGVLPLDALGRRDEPVLSPAITVTRTGPAQVCPQVKSWTNADQSLYAPMRVTRVDHGNTPGPVYYYAWYSPNSRQEKAIWGTYFSLVASPALTRDLSFSNNVGVSLISFASAADASVVWSREMAAFDALLPASRPDVVLRDATHLVWSGTAYDGGKSINSLELRHGSVIVAVGLRSMAAAESIAQAGVAALTQRLATTQGLVDQKCAGG